MSEDDPREQLRQGLGLLAKAAKGAASRLKGEIDKASAGASVAAEGAARIAKPAVGALGGALEEAGRELARAANNVVGKVGEIARGGAPDRVRIQPEPPPSADEPKKEKPKGPTDDDPGFTIQDKH